LTWARCLQLNSVAICRCLVRARAGNGASEEVRNVRNAIRSLGASGVVLFYPGRLLASQVYDWADGHGGCRAWASLERSLPGIRRTARRAELAVIDATRDPAQGADAFLQAMSVLASDSVAVYTERTHEELELMVRAFGAPLLLGPMSMEEWEDFLEHKFPTLIPLAESGFAARREKRMLPNVGVYAGTKVVHYRPNAG
jgi:hypothetical protein